MKIDYNVTGPKRKLLAAAVSQNLNTQTKYLGAPTFAYEIGNYIIDKNGILQGEDDPDLVADLLRVHDFKAATEEYETPLSESEPTLLESPAEETISLIIEIPKVDFTDAALENLKGLMESKAALIKKALGVDCLPILVGEETISFPWFSAIQDSDEIKACTHFISALAEMAKNQKRVNLNKKAVENEKYAFRCFLLRLGFIGDEYKGERKILLSKLTGSSAFKSEAIKQEDVNA